MKSSSTRDSGVPWIGQIRADWPILPAKAVFKQRSTASRPDDVHLTPSQQHGVMPQAEYMALTGNQVVLNLTGADNMRHVEPGDYISHLRSFQGGLEYSAYAGKVSAAYTVLTPRKEVNPHYYRFLFKSNQYVQGLQTTTDQMRDGQSIRYGQFALLPLPYPPFEEQRRIAEFLDRETAQIDELIAKQEQLISTLAERETGLIFDRVTRGLDENVPMSESSLWFERRPSHWVHGNIRHFAAMKTGHTPSRSVPEYWENCEIPWFTLADVWQLRQGNRYLGATDNQISELGLANSAAELLPTGTVVLSRTASVGFTGIMPQPMATSQDFWNWVCRTDRLLPEFLWYQFRAMNPYIRSLMYGSTHKTIYQADAASFQIVVPPLEEQQAIVDSLDELTGDASRAVVAAQRMIDLLRERRQALISAAVTGKIDVGEAS